MRNQWRVTKYNPDLRAENGSYTVLEEWTCPSEIGSIINGKEFTLNDYLQVEAAYVSSAIRFMNESNIHTLRILQLSTLDISEEERASVLYEKEFDEIILKEDREVHINDIQLICKMILRNFISCQLYSKSDFFIHFGWDYYMYIGSSVDCITAIDFAKNNGLYVEQGQSPYYFTEEEKSME